jgi:hypothetical protein
MCGVLCAVHLPFYLLHRLLRLLSSSTHRNSFTMAEEKSSMMVDSSVKGLDEDMAEAVLNLKSQEGEIFRQLHFCHG